MDPSSPDGSFKVAGDHQKDEGAPVAELDLNLVTSKNEGDPKIEAWSNYMKEDGNCRESTMLPSDGSYDGIASHFLTPDSKIREEPCLPSQSELGHDDSNGLSSPAKTEIYHDENECDVSFNKDPSPLENEKNHVGLENEDSALCLLDSFGINNTDHHEVMEKEDYEKRHELQFTDEPVNMHTGDLSGSTPLEGPEFYNENVDKRNGGHHTEMKGGFYSSDKQHLDHKENAPGESDARGFQKTSASPVARDRSFTPEGSSQIQVLKQEEMPSDVNDTRGLPYSTRSPMHEISPSPRRPDKGQRRAPSHDRISPPKRRKSSSPVRTRSRDSDQRVDSPHERSSSPGRTPQRDSDTMVDSPRKHLSVSPSRQDSPQKHGSPNNQNSLWKHGSPERKDSPRRGDSPRRRDSPRRGGSPRRRDSSHRRDSPRRHGSPCKGDSPGRQDSPCRGGSPRRRDSPRRGDSPRKQSSSRKRDSPRRRDLPEGDSPRKRISASPRRRDLSRRRDRSISRSPSGRRDSSGFKRDRHDRSRSRSPYARDHHRRSPRRRHSPRCRSPSPGYHSRRHSPRRRPWSPPSNRNTGIGRPGKNLFVAGFSFVTTERDLEKKFSRFGRVTDVRVVRDKRSGDSRGFGFLSLERDEEADAAIRALDQTEWNGRIVLVEKAKTSVR